MGEYKEKIKAHFWMLVCSSVNKIGNEEAYREKYEPVFKINSKEAIKLIEGSLWSRLYSFTREIQDPNELRKQLEPVVQIEVGVVREHIWKLLISSVSGTSDENTFRENFEPMFRINSKEAVNLVEGHLWTALYSLTRKIQDPKELRKQLESIVQIDVKRAAEAIKEDNPEKFKFLQIYK
ncbi:MAG: hypothetical protein ACXAC8_01035 [Candidatus Hodarchaeales archaeon]|jgi:hypothetical protein